MAIVRWNPFGELHDLQRRMNRLFEDSYSQGGSDEEGLVSHWTPRVDIFEDKDVISITAELPGMEQKDVKVSINNGILSISGERKMHNESKKDNYTRVERFYGSFQRSFTLPDSVAQDKVEAHMDRGLLKISLPKREEAKPKQIEVKVN